MVGPSCLVGAAALRDIPTGGHQWSVTRGAGERGSLVTAVITRKEAWTGGKVSPEGRAHTTIFL